MALSTGICCCFTVALALLALLLQPAGGGSAPAVHAQSDRRVSAVRPNLVMALADDLGFSDVGWVNPSIRTPTLDALALGGVVLHRMYVFCYCSPSRGALLTGRLPHHDHQLNLGNDQTNPVNLNMTMLPAKLKTAGYRTYMIGKWHEGLASEQYTPRGRGFDRSFGFLGGGENHYTQRINTGPKAPVDFWNSQLDGLGGPDPRNGTFDTYVVACALRENALLTLMWLQS
jgi:leishmanolysin-like peptidase